MSISQFRAASKPPGFIAHRFRKQWWLSPELILGDLGLDDSMVVYGNTFDLARIMPALVERFSLEGAGDELARELANLAYARHAPVLSYQLHPPKGWVWFKKK